MTNKYPENYDKLEYWCKKHYDWVFGQYVGKNKEREECFIVEGDSDEDNFYWHLVAVLPEGSVYVYRTKIVPMETYTTEKAIEAMNQLEADFLDFYAWEV